MYYHTDLLRASATMTRSQTFRIDLPKTGLLSALQLVIEAPSVSAAFAAGGNWRLLDYLTTVEVIGNGSTVIKSLQAKHLDFLSLLHQGVIPPHYWRNYATNTQREVIPILFGRNLWDTEFGLDLGKWDNVELRITNTATALTHGADLTIKIAQFWLRASPSGFRGFIRSETWREWATVQDQTQYLILPTEFPISGIILRALPHATTGMSDTGFANLMFDIELSQQGGTLLMFDGSLSDAAYMAHLMMGKDVLSSGEWYGNADAGIDTGVGGMFGWSGVWGSKNGAAAAVDLTMIADATDNTISFEGAAADQVAEFITMGHSYQNSVPLLHVPDLNPDFLLDPKRDGECRLNIHTRNLAAAAAGLNQVVLERLVGSV